MVAGPNYGRDEKRTSVFRNHAQADVTGNLTIMSSNHRRRCRQRRKEAKVPTQVVGDLLYRSIRCVRSIRGKLSALVFFHSPAVLCSVVFHPADRGTGLELT